MFFLVNYSHTDFMGENSKRFICCTNNYIHTDIVPAVTETHSVTLQHLYIFTAL